MISVLLVDDEKLALEYLENIIDWESYGFQLAGVTTDPEQALDIYRRYRPELVISDVKMPIMSGLELVDAIREYGGNSHILFLSAYKNFDYVKQAIRLNIDDYILKSDLDENVFLKKILKLKNVIEKEKAKSSYTVNLIFKELFEKNTSEEDYRILLDEDDYLKIYKSYYYLIFAQRVVPRFISSYISQKTVPISSYGYLLTDICKKNETEKVRAVSSFEISENEYLVILNIGGLHAGEKEIAENIYYYARNVFRDLEKEAKNQFFLYYYGHKSSLKQFGRFYHENKNQLSQRYLKKETQVLELSAEPELLIQQEKVPSSVTSEDLYRMIKQENRERMEQFFCTVRDSIQKEDYVAYLWYIKSIFEAFCMFEGFLTGVQSGRRFSIMEGSSSYDLGNPEELEKFVEAKLNEIWFLQGEGKEKSYSVTITNAMKYIRTHYGEEECTLSSTAKHVHISISWLSTKFKEEVGIGVNDFINSVRIENAKKLFEQDDYMVYEVSEKVGFTSSQYFSKIFKEITGMTPNKYRRRLMDSKDQT